MTESPHPLAEAGRLVVEASRREKDMRRAIRAWVATNSATIHDTEGERRSREALLVASREWISAHAQAVAAADAVETR